MMPSYRRILPRDIIAHQRPPSGSVNTLRPDCPNPFTGHGFKCIANDTLLVTTWENYSHITSRRTPYHYSCGNYIFVFNRIRNAWYEPIPCPAPYFTGHTLILLGFVNNHTCRAFYAVQNYDARTTDIKLFTLRFHGAASPNVIDSQHLLTLSGDMYPHFSCHYDTTSPWLMVRRNEWHYTVYQVDGSTATELQAFDYHTYCMFFTSYKRHLILLFVDRPQDNTWATKMETYNVDTGLLEEVPEFSNVPSKVPHHHHIDRRLIVMVEHQNGLDFEAFDLEKRCWQRPGRVTSTRVGRVLTLLPSGEALTVTGDLSYYRHRLCSTWLDPPRLGRLALDAIHKHMPELTRASLLSSSVYEFAELYEFLLDTYSRGNVERPRKRKCDSVSE